VGFDYEVGERNWEFADYTEVSKMTDIQILTIVLASVPSVIAVLVGILINNSRLGDMGARMSDMNSRMSELRSELRTTISELRSHMDNRFDDMRDTWRAELHRVEEVIDARLKHIEDR
jgi:hypothetical protein